jgi:hypothetical protein
MTTRAARENSVVARFLAVAIGRFHREAKSQELSHRRSTCRHPVFEAKVVYKCLTVDGLKYLKRLETLGAEKPGEHR